jgi:hypothetical protein
MRRKALWLVAVAAAILLMAGPVRAQAAAPWIHVQVHEPQSSSKVSVNLPLSVVQVALEAAPEKVIKKGKIQIPDSHHHDLSVADMRRMWKELDAAGDAQLVSVEDEDETVHVSREGNLFKVKVEGQAKKENVHIEIPVAVVDALFSAEGDELNVAAAFKELQSLRGDIVRVNDEDSVVRIWIDEKN